MLDADCQMYGAQEDLTTLQIRPSRSSEMNSAPSGPTATPLARSAVGPLSPVAKVS